MDHSPEAVPFDVDVPAVDDTAFDNTVVDDALRHASEPYVGRWSQLVSTTNWEKGRIICQWRQELLEDGAPSAQYADETWARLVGGVTGQHVGRLRRVHQRFGDTYDRFGGLYWSHFHAALEWNDAELWLEGAVQNRWSVAQMRTQRWETLAAPEEWKPREEDIVAGELDEDFEPSRQAEPGSATRFDEAAGPTFEGPDFGDESGRPASTARTVETPAADTDFNLGGEAAEGKMEAVRPFAEVGPLPDDVAEAVESLKLAILRHKTSGWQELRLDDLLACLTALATLATSPTDADAPL